MMKRASMLAVAITLCLGVRGAKAETAQEVWSLCRGVAEAKSTADGRLALKNDLDTATCWGLFGAFQGFLAMVDDDGVRLLGSCAPESVTRTQLVRIYQKYVSERPEKGHLPFAYMAQAALVTAFPCSKR